MLDQTAENPEPQAPASEEEAPATVLPFDVDKAWETVLAVSPAMARLPDMVADEYHEEMYSDPKELKEIQGYVRDRVRSGIVFIFQVIGANINKLFENYDLCFGCALDIFMDDLEEMYEASEGNVENYAVEEGCGRLFAYIAIEAFCRDKRKNEPDDGTELDMTTGWFKILEPLPILAHLEGVLNCVQMTAEFRIDVRKEATKVVHFHQFLLLDPDKKTVWH
jgi:hypothetical protein